MGKPLSRGGVWVGAWRQATSTQIPGPDLCYISHISGFNVLVCLFFCLSRLWLFLHILKTGLYFRVATTPSLPMPLRTLWSSALGLSCAVQFSAKIIGAVFSQGVNSLNNHGFYQLFSFLASCIAYPCQWTIRTGEWETVSGARSNRRGTTFAFLANEMTWNWRRGCWWRSSVHPLAGWRERSCIHNRSLSRI